MSEAADSRPAAIRPDGSVLGFDVGARRIGFSMFQTSMARSALPCRANAIEVQAAA